MSQWRSLERPVVDQPGMSAEEAAFREQLSALVPNVERMAKHMAKSQDLDMEAEDLASATLVRALERPHLFEPGTNMGTWLFVMMHNIAQNHIRTTVRRREREDKVVTMMAPPDFAHRVEQRLRLADLDRLCPHLTARECWLLTMFYVEDYTVPQLAKMLGKSRGTISSRITRVRAKILDCVSGQADRIER